jgi:hypothetical protein
MFEIFNDKSKRQALIYSMFQWSGHALHNSVYSFRISLSMLRGSHGGYYKEYVSFALSSCVVKRNADVS